MAERFFNVWQFQRFRILPYLAATYVLNHFAEQLHDRFFEYTMQVLSGDRSDEMIELGKEMHAVTCVSKPLTTWTAQRAIQESREACGGHGFLKG